MKYLVIVAYSGESYSGFQRQSKRPSVQAEIEKQLSFYLGKKTEIKAAGRTDAGVHALGQTFTFECEDTLKEEAFLKALNRLLPEDIYFRSVRLVPDSFDARRNATKKAYRYVFSVNERYPIMTNKIAQLRRDDFQLEPFLQALDLFKGKHDFRNFTTKPEDEGGFIRTVYSIDTVTDNDGNLVTVTLQGDGFMRYQIRMMMGAAIRVGLGRIPLEAVSSHLDALPRDILPYKAPACGLTLMEVFYENDPEL